MAYGPQTSTATVTTAGTRVRLSSTSILSESILVIAAAANTNNVYVGGSDVSSTNGIPLSPGQSIVLQGAAARNSSEQINAKEIWLDADTNGNIARYLYIKQVSN